MNLLTDLEQVVVRGEPRAADGALLPPPAELLHQVVPEVVQRVVGPQLGAGAGAGRPKYEGKRE